MMEGWELPQGWEWKRLRDIAPEDSRQILPTDYPEQVFNYWGLDAIEKGQIDEPAPNIVSGSSIQSTCVRFTSEHILYCKLRPYLNKVIVPSIEGIGSTEWVPLKPHPEIIERKYLALVLRSPQFVQYATSNVAGARMPRMSKKALAETKIPIPYPGDPVRSLAEQRRIVARLEALLGEARALREEVQSMRRDLAQVMESALAEVFPDPQGKVKEGWGWRRLGDFCTTTSGGTPKRNVADYYGGTIPWLKSGELNDGVILQTEETITEKGLNESNAKIFPKGTLLIALYGATVGKLGILEIDSATNQAICAIFPSDDVEKTFLFWFLRAIRQKLLKSSFGGAQPNISQAIIRNLEVPIPYPDDPTRSLAEQRRIVTYLERIAEETRAMDALLEQDLRDLEVLEQSILAAAFRGEV